MFDDFEGYFVENIVIPLKAYFKEKKSKTAGNNVLLRLTTDLCIKLNHLVEHLPLNANLSAKMLITKYPEYKIVKDISNVTKHKTLSKYEPLISNAQKIYEIAVITIYKDQLGEFNHLENTVVADLDDGTQVDLHHIIVKTYNMWLTELKSLGLLTKEYKPIVLSKRKPRRSKQSGKHNIVVNQGIRLKKHYKLQRFNYEKGVIEPVDLTGYKAMFRVYKCMYDLTLEMSHSKTGERKSFTVKVDEEQLKRFSKKELTSELMEEFFQILKEQGQI